MRLGEEEEDAPDFMYMSTCLECSTKRLRFIQNSPKIHAFHFCLCLFSLHSSPAMKGSKLKMLYVLITQTHTFTYGHRKRKNDFLFSIFQVKKVFIL